MAKLSKFQQALVARSQPASAFDVLEEAADRLIASSRSMFPPGVAAACGTVLKDVLSEVRHIKALKVASKAKPADVAGE